jgi:asparagine synthase (glutamine-hydrolysing)
MFALGIWDAPRRRLVLARDRMGQKPLYYANLPGGGIAFGSEPKSVLAHPDVPHGLDHRSLAEYLFYEYLPSPSCIWKGLKKLPRGHVLVWENGTISVRRYWAGFPSRGECGPFEEEAERFWALFREAVDRHTRSDVPLGVFLSGGVDSSSVAAAMAELGPASRIKTFSIGFDDPSFDESAYAREVARGLGTDHRERIFSAKTVLDLLPEVAGWLDEPFGDASVLPTHLLSRFAREEVTVVLGGDGADELLAGYPTFQAEKTARLFRRFPRVARSFAGQIVSRLPVDHRNFSLDFKLKQFLRGADVPLPLAHQRWLGSFSGAEIAELLVEPPEIDVESAHLALAAALPHGNDELAASLGLYQETYLPEDILFKVDRASMAASLEVRAPFLDTLVVDRVQSLPSSYKLSGRTGKRILKAAAAPRLPDSILNRSKKGFGIPVARWLRGELSGLLDDLLGPERIEAQGLFRPEAVARRIDEHRRGVRDHRKPLWTLLMFQLWARHWGLG